ncbi:hypothetical protein B9Z65_7679 [Elsinoe australis]|uniref:Deoxyribonuclease NucA/NucB domain-containing protein n=1 Tax=Elsinoe australis TaxID=40998 RepID=A0A2P8A070_9PEZI|nr:hypothetical protein B9Z65_7679 [Elsinoe australis]
MYIWTLLLMQAALVRSVTFTLGCVRYPSVCNHRCYSVFVAGRPQTVTWDAPTGATKTARRTAAGAIPNPCCGRIAAPAACFDTNGGTVPCTSPDEYPYASTLESVSTSPIIRCTGEEENVEEGRNFGSLTQLNTAEGGCGRRGPCSINIAFSFLTADTPFCNAGGAGLPNDGFDFTLAGGTFVPARRRVEPRWVPHVPDPKDFVPLSSRREFLLDNGLTVLIADSDPNKDWTNELFVTDNGTARMVQELLGQDKSPAFR